MSSDSIVAAHDSAVVVTDAVKFLTGTQRLEICKAVPDEDWDRHANRKFVAVSATTKRILDADDDESALIDRVSVNYADHQVFNAPGKLTA